MTWFRFHTRAMSGCRQTDGWQPISAVVTPCTKHASDKCCNLPSLSETAPKRPVDFRLHPDSDEPDSKSILWLGWTDSRRMTA
jgi:hypothetical protein